MGPPRRSASEAGNLDTALAELVCDPDPVKRRGPGRPRKPDAMPAKERMRKMRGIETAQRKEDIAILDTETDPFDALGDIKVFPFLAVLYSEQFEPVIIWDENRESFIDRVIAAIEALPRKFTIYAHNGGKFDFMFLIHRIRGQVKFKGRGLMTARIGEHELRDSFHIIPEKLANIQKDTIDYSLMLKKNRSKNRDVIINYCLNDCRYLLDVVKKFVNDFGLKLSIGQAAMAELRSKYDVDRISPNTDGYLRHYFFGGRVECLSGRGHFVGRYNLFDVNSMYPFVMATYAHPIGNEYVLRRGAPGQHTVFLDITCTNHGALVRRAENNETSATEKYGRFKTTIWEYEVAKKYGLIENVTINYLVDCKKRSNFSNFVLPLYQKRLETKAKLKMLRKLNLTGSEEYNETLKDDIFYKLLLNNAYGKFAQNPRRFKESYITGTDETPSGKDDDEISSWGVEPTYMCNDYWIWERPCPHFRFNNVGTAASITGASRAVLLEAIQQADDPIYCDTDSLICRDLRGIKIDGQELGAWDIEDTFSEVIVCGKKEYACRHETPKLLADGQIEQFKIRSKGVAGLTWTDFERMLDGQIIEVLAKGSTLTKTGQQYYMRRDIRATAPVRKDRVVKIREAARA